MISDFFITRPVLANVLAILMMVIGGVAVLTLPVAQYPDVVPPTVQVTTRYPGASARERILSGSSQIRMEYWPAPNTTTFPTPGRRAISSLSLMVA